MARCFCCCGVSLAKWVCTSQEYKATWWMLAQYILRDNLLLAGLFFFALVMGFAIT